MNDVNVHGFFCVVVTLKEGESALEYCCVCLVFSFSFSLVARIQRVPV